MFRDEINNGHVIAEIKTIYTSIKPEVKKRLREFDGLKEKMEDTRLFKELVFCLLTPQSRAELCWEKVCEIFEDDFIFHSDKEGLATRLYPVRFRVNKASFIIEAREKLMEHDKITNVVRRFRNPHELRDWLVKNIRGMGYKEASHFLRNIGYGYDMGILDRHILKNLILLGIIDAVPGSLSAKKYKFIEEKMRSYSRSIRIPLVYLDFVLWYKQTRRIFK